jgi:aminopeptidase-like protein
MHELMAELYPVCRSITGDGVRQTLAILRRHIPLEIHEVPSGTPVFDWTVPKEWNIRDAYVKDAQGRRVIDFQESNLHVVSYSIPVKKKVSLEELRKHLFSLPDRPDWIPYRTSYYNETWGFCLSHRQLEALPDGEYEVCVDASLKDGSLTYGEYLIPGESSDEVLVSCHVCHPSLCNDNLSGIAVATFLAAHLSQAPGRATPTGSCSSRGRSVRSPGWRATKRRCSASSTAWWSRAWAMAAGLPTRKAVGAMPR